MYYVDPETAEYTFPEEDRNLIYIFSESLETTLLSPAVGGYEEDSLLPNLEAMASRGYTNYFRMGSEASYSNRDAYLKTNGDYEIYDLVYMKEIGVYPEDYKVAWGYEDYELFEFAKEDLTRISETGELFNYMMLTVDTHFPDGHVCKYCPDEEERQYANVYRCQDQLISDFVKWVQEQDFYENTTIVIAGDHLSMDGNFFTDLPEGAVRTPFNMIINSVTELETTTGRYFTSMDLYPTTLAAMGIEVVGDRLGLGTNLLGSRMTVLEELGFEELAADLAGYSVFYNDKILQDPDIEYIEE